DHAQRNIRRLRFELSWPDQLEQRQRALQQIQRDIHDRIGRWGSKLFTAWGRVDTVHSCSWWRSRRWRSINDSRERVSTEHERQYYRHAELSKFSHGFLLKRFI